MAKRVAMGMLCFSRPVHTALTIAFTLCNKSDDTDFFAFYGINEKQTVPDKTLDGMLKELSDKCGFITVYMAEGQPHNVQGNVDTLMNTLSTMPGYDCYCKIDDDVLIGKKSDVLMSDILLAMEPESVQMLMGQAVPEHMARSKPFCWEARVNDHRIVQRSQKACPMETYTMISKKCLPLLRSCGISTSCDNARGTYGPLTRKVTNAGGKVCLVLTPSVLMQHIGLTTTIEVGNPARSWAPARKWEPRNEIIQVPGFDFAAWEASHTTGTQAKFAIDTITALRPTLPAKYLPHVQILLSWLEKYEPAVADKAPAATLVKTDTRPVQIIRPRAEPGRVLRRLPDGRVVRSPGPVKRVVIRQAQ